MTTKLKPIGCQRPKLSSIVGNANPPAEPGGAGLFRCGELGAGYDLLEPLDNLCTVFELPAVDVNPPQPVAAGQDGAARI